jgi:anti-sigma-K factor RskA
MNLPTMSVRGWQILMRHLDGGQQPVVIEPSRKGRYGVRALARLGLLIFDQGRRPRWSRLSTYGRTVAEFMRAAAATAATDTNISIFSSRRRSDPAASPPACPSPSITTDRRAPSREVA